MKIPIVISNLIGSTVVIGRSRRFWVVRDVGVESLLHQDGKVQEKFFILIAHTCLRSAHRTLVKPMSFDPENIIGEARGGVHMRLYLDKKKRVVMFIRPPEPILALAT